MEQVVKGEKKNSIKYVPINSIQNRSFIIEKINLIMSEKGNGSVIPLDPIPSVTFWIDNIEKRVGMIISRKNFKWGWSLFEKRWYPCSYMRGMGLDVKFDDDENNFFNNILSDNCSKNEIVKDLLSLK